MGSLHSLHAEQAVAGFGLKPIFTSVNLSSVQLIENFVDMVSEILEETGLSPEYLELEITESVAVKNYDYITDIWISLKNGCKNSS